MNPAISTFQGATNTGANDVSNAFVAEFDPTAANGPASLIYATYRRSWCDRNDNH